jgi:hypothetical protein
MRAVLCLLLLVTAVPASGQPGGSARPAPAVFPAPPAAAPGTTVNGASPNGDAEGDWWMSLERIRRELARPDTLRRLTGDDGRIVFRVEVEGRLPDFGVFIGKDTPLVGPSPWGSMTHSDFLELVTPPVMRQYGAFTNSDLLQVLATSVAGAFALKGAEKAVKAVSGKIDERRSRATQEEIRAILVELERRKAEIAAEEKAAEDARKKAEEEAAARKKAEEEEAAKRKASSDPPGS